MQHKSFYNCSFLNLRPSLTSLAHHGTASRHAVQALYERTHDPELEPLRGYFYDKASKAEPAKPQPTYALTGPEDIRYLANGFTCSAA